MTTFTNVQTYEQMEDLLHCINAYDTMVVDTETNGLRHYRDNFVISISMYFPEADKAFNVPYRHGVGKIDVEYSDSHPEGTPFADMNWTGKTKKQLYLQYWYDRFCEAQKGDYFQNIPEFWVEALKLNWGREGLVHYYHNANFDLHMLEAEGFPKPYRVKDTLVLLHIVNEDWAGVRVTAPFTWTDKDRQKNLCTPEQVGTWARDKSGELLKREQQGNRQLKWQAAFVGLENATVGEEELFKAKQAFEDELTDFIMVHLDDSYNDGLVYVSLEKTRQKAYKSGKLEDIIRYNELQSNQRERIRAKVELDSKANMWMLPSGKVAYYAMLDTVLTWQLHEFWLPRIRQWNNEALYEEQCDVMYKVAWQMERNGIKVDSERAIAEIARFTPQIEETQAAFNNISHLIGYGQDVNAGSWQQLLAYFNWTNAAGQAPLEIPLDKSVFPEFMQQDEDRVAGLRSYEFARPDSTSYDVLTEFEDHPIIRLLFEYRKMKKSCDTYLKNWVKAQNSEGFIRFGMNSTGTVSGRWSSSGETGNGQNIPDRNGYQIKKALIEYGDWIFVGIDYGQLEARLAAWIGELMLREMGVHNYNPTMADLFESGVDLHAYTRDMVNVREVMFGDMSDREIMVKLGYTPKDDEYNAAVVAKHCRHIGKTMNFGLIYKGTEYMLSKLLKIGLEPAKVLVERWRKLFPAFAAAQEYYEKLSLQWRENPSGEGYGMYATQPISGRHRKLQMYPEWTWFYERGVRKGFNPQEASAKKVWNNIVQGLGGYICTVSALRIVDKYGTDQIRFFANIHDALDGYIHKDHLHIVKDIMHIMTDWDVTPHLTVDVQGSRDGTWQGLASIKDIDQWIETKGKEGY